MSEVKTLRDNDKDASWGTVRKSGTLELIGQFNLALAVTAMFRSGLAARLVAAESEDERILCEGMRPDVARNFLRYLAINGLVANRDNRWSLTDRGRSLLTEPGLAHLAFYTEAYGPIVSRMAELLLGTATYGADVERDGRALGEHCATLFRWYHTDTVLTAIHGIDCRTIVDLGCGGGQFLVDACTKSPGLSGIGLDISAPAIDFARQVAENAGVSDRVSFHTADAFDLGTWPEVCLEADVVCAVGVVHEHFREGEQAVIDILDTYAELFSRNCKAFILGEPELRYDLDQSDPDLFLVHIFTAQGFPRHREEWLELFPKTKLRCKTVYTRPAAGPRFNFFELQREGPR